MTALWKKKWQSETLVRLIVTEIQRYGPHTHRGTIAHPAHTSMWPHSHLKRFHLLTARPVSLPADVFRGQRFFEKQTEVLRQQEREREKKKKRLGLFLISLRRRYPRLYFSRVSKVRWRGTLGSRLPSDRGRLAVFLRRKFFAFNYGFFAYYT